MSAIRADPWSRLPFCRQLALQMRSLALERMVGKCEGSRSEEALAVLLR